MARKSGRNFRRKAIHRGVASTKCHSLIKIQMRRRHKFKSHSRRLALLKNYFFRSETKTVNLNKKNNIPEYKFSTEIPENYDETYICTLPINPDSMYAYWEIASDDLIEKVNRPETDVRLNVRLRKISPLETDLLNFPEKRQTDCPEAADKESIDVFCEPSIVEISNKINKAIGDLVIQVPENGESYIIDFVQSTESEKEVLIASHEVFINISPTCEAIYDRIPDASEYFGDEEEYIKGKESKLQQDGLAFKDCGDDLKQYLGSASYEI